MQKNLSRARFVLTFLLLLCLALLPQTVFAGISKSDFEKNVIRENRKTPFYTAYNIFHERGFGWGINYKVRNKIPVGTQVKQIRLEKHPIFADEMTITFKTVPDNKKYVMTFHEGYHPGKSLYDYGSMMFTTMPFEEQARSLGPVVLDAIQRGAIVPGMTKEEVIMSYGYPPEHRTPDLDSNMWLYWMNKFRKKRICFDANGLSEKCEIVNNSANDL